MSDDDELGVLRQLVQITGKTAHVAVVQRRLNLVQQTERGRLQILNGEQQRDGGQRFFSAGQLHHVLQLFPRRLGNNTDTRLQNVLILQKLQGSLSAAEQLPEYLVKLLRNLREFFLKLPAHGLVQLQNNSPQRFLRLHQIVVLTLQEGVAVHQVFIILNGVHIHVSQPSDLILQGGDLLLHGSQILQSLIPESRGACQSQLIFVPHIIDLALDGFFRLFSLSVQTVNLLVQAGNRFGQTFPFREETLLFCGKRFLPLQIRLQPQLPFASSHAGCRQALRQRADLLFLFLHLLFVFSHSGKNLFALLLKTGKLAADTVQIFPCKALGLTDLLSFHFNGGYLSCLPALFLSDFLQLFLSRGNLRFQILLRLFGSLQLPFRLLPAVLKLSQTSGNFLLLLLQIVIARLGLFFFLPGRRHVHARRILADEFLLQLRLRLIQLHPQESAPLPDFLRFLQHGIHLPQRFSDLFLKLLDLSAPSQQVAAVFKRAAADRASRREKFALQRDHAQTVARLSGKPHRIVHVIDHQNPSKKGSRHIPVLFLRGHQRIRKADDTGLQKQLPLAEFRPELRSALHAGQRQEGGSSALHRLQEGDHFLCGILVVRHDVLDAAAKSRFDGGFILFLHLQKVRHHAENAGMLLLLLHDPLYASAVALIALRQVDQGVQP